MTIHPTYFLLISASFALVHCSSEQQNSEVEQAAPTPVASESSNDQKLSFNTHIRPILNKNCTSCHGGVHAGKEGKMPSGVSFISRHLALGKRESGLATINC